MSRQRPSKSRNSVSEAHNRTLSPDANPIVKNKTPSDAPVSTHSSSQAHESPDLTDPPSTGIVVYCDENQPSLHDVYAKYAAAMEPILRHLLDSEKRKQLAKFVQDYFDQNVAFMTPRELIVPYALPSMERTIASLSSTEESERMIELGTSIIAETTKPVTIDATTTPEAFMAIFAGGVIRLEYLGIIFAIACWSSLVNIGQGKKHQEFTSHLLRCSGACLETTRILAPMNDMLMWLNHHHYILVATEQGHSCVFEWILTRKYC